MGKWANGTANLDGGPSFYGANFLVRTSVTTSNGFDTRSNTGHIYQYITFSQSFGGYTDAAGTPTAQLDDALNYTDMRLGELLSILNNTNCTAQHPPPARFEARPRPGLARNPQDLQPAIIVNATGVAVAMLSADDGGVM